jgi:signal transduction histidine kinase
MTRDGAEGLTVYEGGAYDVLAVDLHMPVYNGLEVIRRLTERGPLPPLLMVTGTGDEKTAVEALKMGVGDYVVKDVDGHYLELLPTVIEQVLRQHRLAEQARQSETALRHYAAELEARNEELNAFAQTVAHDLANPLGLVIGYAETMRDSFDTLLPEERQTYLESIIRGGQKMESIINDLLLLSMVRETEVVLAPLNMEKVVAEARQRLINTIQASQAEIVLPQSWPIALGYGPWIEEVWFNYLSNALKYGGRPPRIELGADLPSAGMVRFWTRDNGAGIAPEAQARLFTPFTRLDRMRAPGHGLGLSIVHRIVQKLGGQVGVDSTTGQGSVFSFTLRAASAG